ncbi:hypothetical protein HW115_15220 [Verrucomicrobiaceae bacterium N1E253]|uniref:DUF676 domain-containing protein n=1 Tax=Oceaniferula marina TaxID=2748318 RepID=A0A851GJ16_9BACT|nr:hypothetical protein [Oceaniferula marina]NWK56972.1 hypothetical protein [Oceaniferula marina]
MATLRKITIYHLTLIILPLCLLVESCVPKPYFKSSGRSQAYHDSSGSTLNRAWISRTSRQTLRHIRARKDQTPQSDSEHIALAEEAVHLAKKSRTKSPEQSTLHYLQAVEFLWPVIRTTPYPASGYLDSRHKRKLLAHQLYIHSVGQIAMFACRAVKSQNKASPIQVGDKQIQINTSTPHSLHPDRFDSILPLDTLSYGNVGKYHHRQMGLGAAAVGRQSRTPHRLQSNPYIPTNGLDTPINITVDVPAPGKPRLTITDLLQTQYSHITGTSRLLSADYSAPIAAVASTESSFMGLSLALNPEQANAQMGLFAIGLQDPNKIPVIFVHGLISQPSTWTTATNHLMADPLIRENYQFYYYLYQTGQNPIISGAQFRRTLIDFYQNQDHHPGNQLDRTVLIGHSMGGLLSSMQSRTFDNKLLDLLYIEKPTGYSKDSAYGQTKILIEHPTLKQIERTIFVATPHLGSGIADNWIGQVGSSLVKLPQSMSSLQLDVFSDNMTEFGRALVGNAESPNSVNYLKSHNPALTLISKQPFNKRITYHSIMGNRGLHQNHPQKSSDGVVPYWSSHLKGADSEILVPSLHDAQLHPEAHREMTRILHLHLAKKKHVKP